LHSQSWFLLVGSDSGWSIYECGLRNGEELASDCWFSVMIYYTRVKLSYHFRSFLVFVEDRGRVVVCKAVPCAITEYVIRQ
jgi:hypothetical protein